MNKLVFRLFKRKQNSLAPTKNKHIERRPKYYIPTNSRNPKKEYDLLLEEELFFDALLDKSAHLKGEYSLLRLSDGSVNVSYNEYPVGKVKLHGRKKHMMYMKNLFDPLTIEGELNDFINTIDKWIVYIERNI